MGAPNYGGGILGGIRQAGANYREREDRRQQEAQAMEREVIGRKIFENHDRRLIDDPTARQELAIAYRGYPDQYTLLSGELDKRISERNFRRSVPMLASMLGAGKTKEEVAELEDLLNRGGLEAFNLVKELMPDAVSKHFDPITTRGIGPEGGVQEIDQLLERTSGIITDRPGATAVPSEDLAITELTGVTEKGQPTGTTATVGKRTGTVTEIGKPAPKGSTTSFEMDENGRLRKLTLDSRARTVGAGQGKEVNLLKSNIRANALVLTSLSSVLEKVESGEGFLSAVGAGTRLLESAASQIASVTGIAQGSSINFMDDLSGLALPPHIMQGLTGNVKMRTAIQNLAYLLAVSRKPSGARSITKEDRQSALTTLGVGFFGTPQSNIQGEAALREVVQHIVRTIDQQHRSTVKDANNEGVGFDILDELSPADRARLAPERGLIEPRAEADLGIRDWDDLSPAEQKQVIRQLGKSGGPK